jgi:hypothetical protein
VLYCCCLAVAFSDNKKCAEGFDTIADGTLNSTKTGTDILVHVGSRCGRKKLVVGMPLHA